MMIASAAVRQAFGSGDKIASLDLRRLDGTENGKVELVLDGVRKTAGSLELRVLLSSGSEKPLVAGSLYTYGEGFGEERDQSGRFSPMRLSLDVTEAARRLAGTSRVDVRVQVLDSHGRDVKERLFVDHLELHRLGGEE
jgi:hypothetical protein